MLPLFEDAIVLVRHFRHGVRDWCLEVPRGSTIPGRTDEETARVELLEEIGATAADLHLVGHVHVNSGLSPRLSIVYYAKLLDIGPAQASEGIDRLIRSWS